jgi:hypothetical protein
LHIGPLKQGETALPAARHPMAHTARLIPIFYLR